MADPYSHLTAVEREWLKLAEAAAPGPWETGAARSAAERVFSRAQDLPPYRKLVAEAAARGTTEQYRANAAFIAASRTAVPALLAEVDRLRGALAMGLQLTDSGNHDGTNDACPTCHWANVARDALSPIQAGEKETT